MNIFLGLIGIGCSYLLIKYRERIGDMVGDPIWTQKVGGIYNVLIILGLFLFFWSIAMMTGTADILFRPLLILIPGYRDPSTNLGGGVPLDAF